MITANDARAFYALSVDYTRPIPLPPLMPPDAAWAKLSTSQRCPPTIEEPRYRDAAGGPYLGLIRSGSRDEERPD